MLRTARHFEAPAEVRRIEIEIEIADRSRVLARTRERADNAMELASESKRPEPRALYHRLVAEADAVDEAIGLLQNQLVVARGAVSPAEHVRRIEELRGGMLGRRPAHVDDDVHAPIYDRVA